MAPSTTGDPWDAPPYAPPFPVPTLDTNDLLSMWFAPGLFIVCFTFVSLILKASLGEVDSGFEELTKFLFSTLFFLVWTGIGISNLAREQQEKIFVSDALVATLFGVILGPYVSKYFDPFAIQPPGTYLIILYIFSEFLLVVQIVAATIALSQDFWRFHWRSFTILLGPVTFAMFTVTTLLTWGITGLPFLDAMLVGAACSPTDPVLANSIVKGRFADLHVSPIVRDLLSAESAANDGMGYPFLLLGIYLIRYYYHISESSAETYASRSAQLPTKYDYTPPNAHIPGIYPSAGSAVLAWFVEVILYQIGVAAVLGAVIGYSCRKLLVWTENRGWIDKETMLGFAMALSMMLLGLGNVLNISGFVLSAVGGVCFSWDEWVDGRGAGSGFRSLTCFLRCLYSSFERVPRSTRWFPHLARSTARLGILHSPARLPRSLTHHRFFHSRVQDSHIQEVIDTLLTSIFFIFFGACVPWAAMNSPELPIWKLLLLSLAVLVLRRLPTVVLLYPGLRSLANHKEAYFVGYFGPIGVAAIW
jgi:NhaP-type Na+/H+ or K+/H+ antiporter